MTYHIEADKYQNPIMCVQWTGHPVCGMSEICDIFKCCLICNIFMTLLFSSIVLLLLWSHLRGIPCVFRLRWQCHHDNDVNSRMEDNETSKKSERASFLQNAQSISFYSYIHHTTHLLLSSSHPPYIHCSKRRIFFPLWMQASIRSSVDGLISNSSTK